MSNGCEIILGFAGETVDERKAKGRSRWEVTEEDGAVVSELGFIILSHVFTKQTPDALAVNCHHGLNDVAQLGVSDFIRLTRYTSGVESRSLIFHGAHLRAT